MKTKIFKGGKVILSLILATSMLIASLFTANVGININAEAAEGTTLTWDGNIATAFSDTAHDGLTEANAIIISTPEELAYLAKGADGNTAGKYYKIANGIKYFNMNGNVDVTVNSTAAEVAAASETGNYWGKTVNKDQPFKGSFDGNGVVIYNIRCTGGWSAGLFPCINSSEIDGFKTTIKNVSVKASYFDTISGDYTYGSGAIFGAHINTSNNKGTLVEKCAVINNYVKCGARKDNSRGAGAIAGSVPWDTTYIHNCLVKGNTLVSDANATVRGGLVCQRGGAVDIEYTVVLDSDVMSANVTEWDYCTGVYTDQTTEVSGVTPLTTNDMTGANAKTNMSALAWGSIWWANTSTPELIQFHTLEYVNNNDGTHSPTCSDCGLIGIAEAHNYVINTNGTQAVCSCGAVADYVTDTWDGTIAASFHSGNGTQADPYIIATAEQMAYVALSTTLDSIGKYFEIAKCVKYFDMNGMQGVDINSDSATVDTATKNASHNWNSGNFSTGSASFEGNFDGNGAIIYNIYSSGAYAGLFPYSNINNSTDISVKNVTVTASYFSGYHGAGGILGYVYSGNGYKIDVNKVTIKNCYIIADSTNTECNRIAGSILGKIAHSGANIVNCLVKNNTVVGGVVKGGFIGNTTDYGSSLSISNSITIGTKPEPTGDSVSTKVQNTTYTNVYTDQETTVSSGVTVLTTDQMKGDTAVDNMDLAWFTDWNTVENDYPVPYTPVYNYDYWQGNAADNFKKDANGNYLIENADQLYAMVKNDGMVNDQAANFKVADGVKELYLSPIKDLVEAGKSTNAIMKVVSSNSNNWNIFDASAAYDSADGFKGTFDGNGVTIYGMHAEANNKAGFIPTVSSENGATIKNVNFKYSYLKANNSGDTARCGVVVGSGEGWWAENGAVKADINIENVRVENATFGGDGRKSGIVGSAIYNLIKIKNCFVAGIDETASDFHAGKAFVASGHNIETSVSVGTTADNDGYMNYINVCRNMTYEQATGAAAKDNMPNLNWSTVWIAANDSEGNGMYPQFRYMHNLTLSSQGKSGHIETCSDCGIVGAIVTPHTLTDVDANTSTCECGFQAKKITVWNGTTAVEFAGGSGTKDDPFIITTAEQLHKMVRVGGVNSEGKPAYYQVAKGVTELYLNDTRLYETVNDFAANSGSLKNWSCYLSDYSHSFDGYFDGNGVTIYGLYSEITNATSNFLPGVGFVPSLAFDATIKNVIFDTSYVKSNTEYAAVVTASTGNSSWSGSQKISKTANITLMNIAVKNAVVYANGDNHEYQKDKNTDEIIGHYSYPTVAGILVTRDAEIGGLKINNCLFDGKGSNLDVNTSKITVLSDQCIPSIAGIYAASSYGADSKNFINSCLSIDKGLYKIFGSITETNSYSKSYEDISSISDFKSQLPLLNWAQWGIVKGYYAPMPLVNSSWDIARADYYENAVITEEKYAYNTSNGSITNDYSNILSMGGYASIRKYENGEFSAWNTLSGSGTAADPYVINDALTLYQIIAVGGCNLGVPQHFVLGSDLDLGSVQWVVMKEYKNSANIVQYQYTPFAGVLDGAGHTITGLYTYTDEAYAGFIPQINGGTVKNLHIRNSYVSGATNCGIIVGGGSGTVEGCSVENCDGTIKIANGATIKNSYINDSYYNASGDNKAVSASDIKVDYTGNSNNSVWYKGSLDSSKPKLVNRAVAMPCADIDGDGEGYEYTSTDLAELKQKLLRKTTHQNVYGDVSHNGITDMRDMVSLRREKIAESDPNEWTALDGFWRNLKNGKFEIHYTETDNYDFARKLELYFAEIVGVTVNKHMTAGDNSFDIVLKKDPALEKDNFKVAYDLENAVLTFSGGSFTAVEQAVLNFIENSDPLTNAVYTGDGSVADYKKSVTVGGTDYYYAWGDEFDKPVGNTVNYSKWIIHNQEVGDIAPSDAAATYEKYEDGKIGTFTATRDQHKNLNVVSDGRLELKREVKENTDGYLEFYGSGVTTEQTMLFKRGYMEMVATVPSDGYSFPAWWLQTTMGHNNNFIANSLYSKIYELNDAYNGALYYTPTDYQTYKYKLPNHTTEIDIFEVIQKPDISGYTAFFADLIPSSNKNLFFGLHKWYSYNYNSADSKLYNLDWNNLPPSGNYSFSEYADTSVNAVSTDIKSNNKYKTDYSANKKGNIDGEGANPLRYYYGSDNIVSNNVINKLKYTFLWNDSQLVFGCYKNDGNGNYTVKVYEKSINLAKNDDGTFDMEYDGVAPDMNQYAFMMLDNSMWTSSARNLGLNVKKSLSTENLTAEAVSNLLNSFTIDYVRLYQENDKRDIVTAETEAFNSNSRWTSSIYN